jgi:AraC-like DNA-binding protein
MDLSEEQARNQAIEIADPYFFDAEEIKAAALAEGITLTDEQARALARETDEAEATAAYRAELDPQAVIEDEAREFFNFFGYTPNSDELAQFVLAKPESEVKDLIGQYVDPRQVTKDEVETFIKGIGYEATPEEISQFVRQGPDITQEGVFGEIGSYIDPRMVTEEEVRQAYDLLGLKKPTTEDIQKLVGQYDQADLSSRAEANLEVARINSIMQQLDILATTANQETLSAINNVRLDLTGQLQALGVDVGKPAVTDDPSTPDIDESQPATGLYAQIQAQSADTRQALLSKMAEYEAAGISRDQALDQAINDVSNQLGIAKTELSTQIGKPAIQDDPTTTIDESAPPTGIYQTLFEMEQARIAEAEAIRQAMEEQRLAQQVEEANRAAATQRQQLLGKGLGQII